MALLLGAGFVGAIPCGCPPLRSNAIKLRQGDGTHTQQVNF
ncbi:MAG: hypothetical protein ABFS56_34805 [Pseudomonadota bacterium]